MTTDRPPEPSTRAKPSGRRGAEKALLAIDKAGLLADDLFDQMAARESLDLRERAFMVELVRGVLRYRGTIDWRLGLRSDRPIGRLPTLVQNVLRLGAYQLLFLDKVPESAAVNESVHMMKRHSKRLGRDWSGFVNALLRALLRQSEPGWPDAVSDPSAAFAVRYSCPGWLVERWCRQWGAERAENLCRASVELPPLTLRVNTLRTSRMALLQEFATAQVAANPTMISSLGIQVARSRSVNELPGYDDGWFYVEDEAGQLIPSLLDVQPGHRVLDACAAPGEGDPPGGTHGESRIHCRGGPGCQPIGTRDGKLPPARRDAGDSGGWRCACLPSTAAVRRFPGSAAGPGGKSIRAVRSYSPRRSLQRTRCVAAPPGR